MMPVVKISFFIILLNLFSYQNAFSEGIWRYTSKEGDGTLFSTRNLIVLEHVGTNENVEWCYPNDCSLKNKSFTRAILHCPKPGFHPVAPISSSNDQSVRYIQVVHSPFYYEWYLAHDREPKNESQEEFKLWIMDPKHISESERNRTASFPSKLSKELTKVFFQLGQRPFVKAKVGSRFVNWDEWKIYNRSFITSEGFWQFSVDSVLNHQTTVWIDGQSVALHDGFIRRSSLQLMKTKFPFSVTNQPAQVVLTGAYPTHPIIVQDPCAGHVAVFISSKCLFTQDNFASTKELKVTSELLTSEAVVKSVVFSAENVVVLLESGRVVVFNGATQTWGNPSGLPQQGFSGLASQKKCFEGAQNKVIKGIVLGWTNESDANIIYISKDSGVTFQHLAISALSVTIVSIEHAEIHCLFPVATILVNATSHDNQQKMLFLQYNLIDEAWEENEFQLPSLIQEPPVSFFFTPPSTQFVIVWSQKTFAFGRLNKTGSVFKVKRQENLTDFILGGNEAIVSVIGGGHGDFAIHLSNNRMFYGRAFIRHVVEVFAGEDPSSSLTIMFDMLGSLLTITHDNDTARARKLPVENEVLNSLYPHISCPYLMFSSNIRPDLHVIDKGDELKVLALLIYPRVTPNDIKAEISSSDVLRIRTEDNVEHYSGIITLNRIFTFIYDVRNGTYSPKSPYKSIVVSVQLFPSVRELTCENELQVLHISVGCPPSKTVVIRNCSATIDDKPTPFLSQVQGVNEQDVCHLEAAVSERFKLVLDLYEGDRFVQEVQTDYVVWEETGRTDYGYTATMSEAGCIKEAQSWRKLTGNSSGNITHLWTQNNYQSCFEPGASGKTFDGSQPYEILNSSGISQLVFQGSGLFRFQLRIVGAHLSFCELSTRFSVDVASSDEEREFLPQVVSVLVVTLGSTVLLYISFARYTKKTLDRHQKDEEEQQRLQELKSLFSSFQQGEDDVGLAHRRSTSHNVRRFTGTAMLMTNKLPDECLTEAETILESSEPSSVSLRSRKSSHTRK